MCLPRSGGLKAPTPRRSTNHDVTIFKERAEVTGPNSIKLASGKEITAGKILIATGARPVMPQIEGIEHAISSNETFNLAELPKRIVIAGGGYIANEFAGIFHQFGSHVTLVNRTDVLLRHYDQQIVDRLIQISLRKGHRLQVQRVHRAHREARQWDAAHQDERLRRHRGRSASVRARPQAEYRRALGWKRRASSLATIARSRSMPTTARRCRQSSRSATSPTGCS